MHSPRRQQIEDAASSLFSRRGYAGTSVRDIARALDLQGGSLYAHIPSKESVLWSIVEQAARRFHGATGPIAAEPGSAADRLRRMVAAHVEVVTQGRERAYVFLHEWKFLSPERRAEIAESRDAYERSFADVIGQGVAAGELAPADPQAEACPDGEDPGRGRPRPAALPGRRGPRQAARPDARRPARRQDEVPQRLPLPDEVLGGR